MFCFPSCFDQGLVTVGDSGEVAVLVVAMKCFNMQIVCCLGMADCQIQDNVLLGRWGSPVPIACRAGPVATSLLQRGVDGERVGRVRE